jgi:hypothetical protein
MVDRLFIKVRMIVVKEEPVDDLNSTESDGM